MESRRGGVQWPVSDVCQAKPAALLSDDNPHYQPLKAEMLKMPSSEEISNWSWLLVIVDS